MNTLKTISRLLAVFSLSAIMTASTFGQVPVHRYSFDKPEDGKTVTDSIGGAHGEVIAEDLADFPFENGQLDLTANIGEGSNVILDDAYVDLPNGIISGAANTGTVGAISLEWWATVEETRTWSRFGDFGSSNEGEDTSVNGNASEYILVTPNSGRFGDGLEITNHPASNAAEPNVGVQGPLENGVEAHVVAIWDHTDTEFGDNGSMHLYLDGEYEGSNELHEDFDLVTMEDNNNWLGRSQWNDPLFVGKFNEFRVYDVALEDDQVTSSFEAGPDAEIGGGDVQGDFNSNGMRDPGDLDLLAAAMAANNDPAFDLNGDGNVDLEDRRVWVEDLTNTFFGDSTYDGEFSSADFVAVFTTAKYETGQPATWTEGDWNGDGVFGSADFVTAFSGAGYETGPKEGGLMVVPEPISIAPALFGIMLLAARRRRTQTCAG